MSNSLTCRLLVLLALQPATAQGHAFLQPQTLPIPYWMYISGALAALLGSFLLVGFFVSGSAGRRPVAVLDFGTARWLDVVRRLRLKTLFRIISVGLLVLCIVSGLLGNADPQRNFNMTFFWVVFSLGGLYLAALVGNYYRVLNPWRILAEWLQLLFPGFGRGRVAYPAGWGTFPALMLYFGFVWVELLGNTTPRTLAETLVVYTLLNLFFAWLVGIPAWFRYGEFFAVLMRLVGTMGVLRYRPQVSGAARWQLQPPFLGLLRERPDSPGMILFVLFMLSSTAFDGLSETTLWFGLFWKDATGLLEALLGQPPIHAYVMLRPWYFAYETFWLLLSPFLYLAVVLLFLWLGRFCARSGMPLRELLLAFSFSLIPIAFVYHFTHYYTLLLSQGVKIRALISDPFGQGWDLFGTALTLRTPIIPTMESVWYTQVTLIVIGHMVGVYVAHVEALRMFATRRAATLSQIPMLALMMLLTGVGLWILAQPMMGR